MKNRLLLALLLIGHFASMAQPKFFRVMFREDPATSFVLGISQEQVGLSRGSNFKLYYSTNDYGTDTVAYASDNPAKNVDRTTNMKNLDHYFFRLNGLKPNTPVYFIVAYEDALGNKEVSERYWTSTLPDNPDAPLSIISGGDSRADLEHPDQTAESIIIRQQANIMVSKIRPHFVAFGGDYTFANSDSEWLDWFTDWELTHTPDKKITPIVPAIGNHEYPPFAVPAGAPVVHDMFDTPSADVYYALNFGGNLLRLYTLNSEIAIPGDQTNWLVNDLQQTNTSVYWKMAQFHKPIRPHEAGKSDLNDAFDNWAQPFWDYQVRLVVESDAHVVKTTFPVMPTTLSDGQLVGNDTVDHNFVKSNNRGIVFVGEGTWAALRDGNDPKLWTKAMGGFNQVKWIWVNKDTIQVRTVITYDPNDPDYVKNIQPLSDNNRFVIPNGIQLWNPPSGEVVYITENGTTARPALGIDHISADKVELLVWPNHVKNHVANVMLVNSPEKEASLELYNINGQLLHKERLQARGRYMETQINLESFDAGMIFVKVESGSRSWLKKLVYSK